MTPETSSTTGHKCPYCDAQNIDTVATTPYVRGFLLAYQIGSKTYLGCVSCVRKKVLGEAGLSSLIGWFSLTAVIINPILILYNLGQTAFIGPKVDKVKRQLKEMGIPEEASNVDIVSIGYSLAACMIAADGKIEAEELAIAEQIGAKIFDDFNTNDFRMIVKNHKQLPEISDLASLLKKTLTDDAKALVYDYLHAIANADGDFAKEEKVMLDQVAKNMEYAPAAVAAN